VVVESVKLADDRSGDLIVRLYEPHGDRAAARLRTSFPLASAAEVDLLERPAGELPVDSGAVDLTLRPFQIRSLRLSKGVAH